MSIFEKIKQIDDQIVADCTVRNSIKVSLYIEHELCKDLVSACNCSGMTKRQLYSFVWYRLPENGITPHDGIYKALYAGLVNCE